MVMARDGPPRGLLSAEGPLETPECKFAVSLTQLFQFHLVLNQHTLHRIMHHRDPRCSGPLPCESASSSSKSYSHPHSEQGLSIAHTLTLSVSLTPSLSQRHSHPHSISIAHTLTLSRASASLRPKYLLSNAAIRGSGRKPPR